MTKCDCAAAANCPEPCDDRLACNGIEMCHGGEMCMPGEAPCPAGAICREPLRLCLTPSRAPAGEFSDCISGPNQPPAGDCNRYDLDDDGDCDLADYDDLQRAFMLP